LVAPNSERNQSSFASFLFIVAIIITVLFVAIIFPFAAGGMKPPTLDQLPLAAANASYYAIIVFLATPIALLYILWTSRMRETLWDRIFFSSSLCLYLYVLSLTGFILLAIWDALSPTPTASILQALFNNPIAVGTLWIIMFSMPPVLLNTPIGYAAHFEKHGFKGTYPPLGSLSFTVTSAAAAYMLLHLTPLMMNPFGLLVTGLTALLLAMTWLTLLMQILAQGTSVAWLIATALVTAGVTFLVQALAV
jgi:hypothetical protein